MADTRYITLPIKRLTVLVASGTDRILIELDGPTPFPEMQYPANLSVEVRKGYGVEWCCMVFGEPDEVLDAKEGKITGRHTG